ncbi:sugar ABC transporter permease [Clostridium thermosuccinogenes]|mgnify:CR=1 FL=1|uniref:Sugar ABC transporter permease n=1 Tax=Clostridium thermosuccinogenes TaxID=84032 RepID=A0A2K2EX67_9CLOT|nr:ABC transporter permease subunit [Pseudoclostridium thermosuccinogenes]AUS98218.1 sugar ABC transporter permease [Pseudoclostridium thermosuccinogenes]PNT91126.1 sugar ABC transporter permease [Pseudoclostridium thermosuccinogenes]PNT97166.1 sugar ABC transporter permease [Pseudoclostridium thermosuccinogenes]PNT99058.1 sugar ABC transporter permease [Pseudoclostridium thermosuccinogenes]
MKGDRVLQLNRRRRGFLSELITNKALYLMAAPGILFLLVFSYYPMLGIQIAFRDYNFQDGIWHSPFVGFKYFKIFFKSPYADDLLFTTLYLNLLFIITGHVVAVSIAILLNEITNSKLRRIYQSAMFFPYFLSWVIISALVYSFLNDKFGALNMVLKSIGLQPVTWYNEPGLWRGILTVINTWQSFGYNVVIYLAAIVSINNELYESAKIDGASKFDEIFRITLPQITPTIVLMLLLALGRIFYGNFGMIYAIIGDNGVLNKTTDVIDTYIYRAMRSDGDFSTGTAIGLFQSVCGFITVMIFNKLAKKYDDSMGLF